jgi:hypothetical protein
MLNVSPVRLGGRESVSLGRFQNCNLLKKNHFRKCGVEDESWTADRFSRNGEINPEIRGRAFARTEF